MDIASTWEIIKDNLPKGVKLKEWGNYNISFEYVDPCGDASELSVTSIGHFFITTDAKVGSEMPPEFLDFMWRVSRIIRDLPCG